ncbi:hypothetical protein [Solibacillus sp. FSL W7-1324]|uniref:hypothetical protein n=1 Tax=Solibacillus sp. FSL W7-1324 TaxID=2921701 RepID=UPI0030F79D60
MAKKRKTRRGGVDAGNGEAKFWFEGAHAGIAIPTAEIEIFRNNDKFAMLANNDVTYENIHERLDVTFVSSKALEETNRRYKIGGHTLSENGVKPDETEFESKKYASEIIARSVLAGILVDALKQKHQEVGSWDFKSVKASYDIALALPLMEINPNSFSSHALRFIGTHEMIFHFPNGQKIEVTIEIEFASTFPEGAIAVYPIMYNLDGTYKQYTIEVNGQTITTDLSQYKILLTDIGAGTLDLAVMNGVNYDYNNSKSLDLGTKEDVFSIIEQWNEHDPLNKIDSLTQFTKIYSSKDDFRTEALVNFASPRLSANSKKIGTEVKNIFKDLGSKSVNVFCGGGSILYRSHLTKIMNSDSKYQGRTIFSEHDKFTNSLGLLMMMLHEAFDQMKDQYISEVQGQGQA